MTTMTGTSSLVHFDTALVNDAIDEITRRQAAKAARDQLRAAEYEHQIAALQTVGRRSRARARRMERLAFVLGGLLLITWGTAGLLVLRRLIAG